MAQLNILQGKNTPTIKWDTQTGIYIVEGKSFPENAKKFYTPVLDWMDQEMSIGSAHFKFYFYYLSSSSVISMYQILKKLELMVEQGLELQLEWCYDRGDEDVKRIGKDFKKLTSLDIHLVEFEEEEDKEEDLF